MPLPDCDHQLLEARRLLGVGRRSEAAVLFGELLTGSCRLEALQCLGRISFETGNLEAAQSFYAQALELAPGFLEGVHLRGVALMQLGRTHAALECFDKALALNPLFKDALLNHATALLQARQPNEALAGFDRLLALDPNNAVAWNNKGNALVALQRFEEAVTAYDGALTNDPELQTARENRFYALLALRKVDRMSDFAVRDAFDPIASRYDDMALHDLHYSAPRHLRALALRVLGQFVHPWSILDLGCGTGLAGSCFKDLAIGCRLDGVDISPRMIEQATKRGTYDNLRVADFEANIAEPGVLYDLIISADALVYLGDLAPTFAGVARTLKRGGVFLFTCEAKDGDGWELTEANRFRHSESYLRATAARAGLFWLDMMACVPRSERGNPVAGLAIALGKIAFDPHPTREDERNEAALMSRARLPRLG